MKKKVRPRSIGQFRNIQNEPDGMVIKRAAKVFLLFFVFLHPKGASELPLFKPQIIRAIQVAQQES